MSVERMQMAIINMIMRTDARTLKLILDFVGAITMGKPEVDTWKAVQS